MDRKTKGVGLAAGVTTIILWQLGWWYPEMMETAPIGLEAGITAVVATLVARFTNP